MGFGLGPYTAFIATVDACRFNPAIRLILRCLWCHSYIVVLTTTIFVEKKGRVDRSEVYTGNFYDCFEKLLSTLTYLLIIRPLVTSRCKIRVRYHGYIAGFLQESLGCAAIPCSAEDCSSTQTIKVFISFRVLA